MNEYENITCGILTPWNVSSRTRASLVLELLKRHSWVMPTHIGNEEPIRQQYAGDAGAMKHWLDPFLWKNSTSKVEGSVWFGRGEKHSCIYLGTKFSSKAPNQEAWIKFLCDASVSLQADLGYIHLTTSAEADDKSIPYPCTYAIDTGITTHDLVKGVPNLCWAMVFGGHYQNLANRFRRYAPTITRELGEDRVYVQLTGSLFNLRNDYSAFNQVRIEIAKKMGGDFLSCSEVHWRPTFIFESK